MTPIRLCLISVPVLGHLMTARTTPFSAKMSERVIHADPAAVTPERIEHAVAIARRPDPGTAPEHLDAVTSLIPHARTHAIPDVGHMPQIERPAVFAEIVRKFLTEESPPSGD